MRVETVPFEEDHLGAAATLLAEQLRTARRLEPSLSARFVEAGETRKPLDFVRSRPMAGGVVAVAEGEAIGFMLGLAFPEDVSHYALAPFSAVSESWDDARLTRREVLRDMYAALAEKWVEAGCIGHYPSVPVSEPELIEAWYSLGFGQDNVVGVHDTAAPAAEAPGPNVEIRRARVEDLASMQSLFHGLGRHLAGSPTFIATRLESWTALQKLDETLAREGPDVFFLALSDGRAIAMQHLMPTAKGRPYLPEGCIQLEHAFTVGEARGSGVGTALFATGLAWAREEGYERCVVHWEPANLGADRFWNRHGVRPFSYLLGRRLDRGWPQAEADARQIGRL